VESDSGSDFYNFDIASLTLMRQSMKRLLKI